MKIGKMSMIDKIRNWALLAPALVPLVYLDVFFYPLVATKAFFFRIALTVAVLAVAYLVLKNRELYMDRLRTWWAWIPGALLVVAYITSLFGVDFYQSFWSVFDRSAGLLALTYITVYFYLLVLTISKEFVWRFIALTSGVASVVAVYSILQWLGEMGGVQIPGILSPDGRIGGTVGNAAFLAGYLGLTFFLTLVTAYRSAKREDWWFAAALVQLVAVFITATRGTMLALIAMGVVALIYMIFRGRGNMRKIGAVGIAGLVVVSGLFFGFKEQLKEVPFAPIARIAKISTEDATTSSRLFVWENMLIHAAEKPLTGYGAEHIDYVFDKFYNPQDIIEQWFDRAHNLYLDYLIQYGVVGLLLFLLFIGGLIRTAFVMRQKDLFIGNMLLLLVGTYALQSFFVFDTLNTWVVLFPLFAFGFVSKDDTAVPVGYVGKGALVLLGVASVAGLYFAVLQPAYANLRLGEAYFYHVEDPERATQAIQKGYALGSFADLEYGYQLYSMYTDRQQHLLRGEEKVMAYTTAHTVLSQNAQKYPHDARTLVYLGHVIEDRPTGVVYDEEENIDILEKAMELSPGRAQAYYMLANIYIAKGNTIPEERERWYGEAVATVETYAQKAPNLAEPHLVLAELYAVIGEAEKSKESFVRGVALYNGDGDDARRIAGYLLARNEISEARPYLEHVYAQMPDDYVVAFDLAKVRFLEGDIEGAVAIVEKIQLEQPEILQTDPLFIQSLQNALQ